MMPFSKHNRLRQENAEEPNARVLPSYAPRLRRPVIKIVVPPLVGYPATLCPRSVDDGLEDVTGYNVGPTDETPVLLDTSR